MVSPVFSSCAELKVIELPEAPSAVLTWVPASKLPFEKAVGVVFCVAPSVMLVPALIFADGATVRVIVGSSSTLDELSVTVTAPPPPMFAAESASFCASACTERSPRTEMTEPELPRVAVTVAWVKADAEPMPTLMPAPPLDS